MQKFPGDEHGILDSKFRIGITYYRLGDYEDAIRQLKSVLLDPLLDVDDEAETQFYIAESYSGLGKKKIAIAEYLKVCYYSSPDVLMPFKSIAYYRAADLSEQIGDLEHALEFYEEVAKFEGAGSEIGGVAQRAVLRVRSEIESLESRQLNE
jgi:tetratricopeptide (TPR) repeat protein